MTQKILVDIEHNTAELFTIIKISGWAGYKQRHINTINGHHKNKIIKTIYKEAFSSDASRYELIITGQDVELTAIEKVDRFAFFLPVGMLIGNSRQSILNAVKQERKKKCRSSK